MSSSTALAKHDPLDGLEPHDVVAAWHVRRLDELSDAALVGLATRHLAVPRRDPADSFVLHAPLELMARAALLRHVGPATRKRARQRIIRLTASYDSSPAMTAPRSTGGTADVAAASSALHAAVAAGDLEGIDRATATLAAGTSAGELVAALADLVVGRLSAAGHGAIFLYHLPRLLAADPSAAAMARGLLRDIGRNPSWELTWMDHRESSRTPTRDLAMRLLDVASPGPLDSNFIYPTMSLVERSGLAAELLDAPTKGLPVPEARHDLLRVAAWSMLQDDPVHAPYGWSHALTMPQGALGVAPSCAAPQRAVAVAATFVLGLRATLGSVVLDPTWHPERRDDLDPSTFLDAGPDGAAAAVWHTSDGELPGFVDRLVTHAALHQDAHLAKYTLACIDATRDDPAAGRLFLAAAAFLGGWWRTRGDDDDLFTRVGNPSAQR
ncbi:MAG: hypothetical protein ABIR68_18720 [Ilumatobacteraceae bacterium]